MPLAELVAGVDEAGRGPLAGPVVAAAVILPAGWLLAGLRDSKKLKPGDREELAVEIKRHAIAWSIRCGAVEEIDGLNILNATMLAMQRAVNCLMLQPATIQVDGNRAPELRGNIETIVGGDDLEPAISAASILAKVYRDHLMTELDTVYPGYGFGRHKGYGTRQHLEVLRKRGATPAHRRSFSPVKNIVEEFAL